MPLHESIDDVDREILAHLTKNARQPAVDIAERVGLSPAATRRRITRLEGLGVIAGYTVVLDHDRVGPTVEAYVELTYTAKANVDKILNDILKSPEVREVSIVSGDVDAVVRLRVNDLDHLRSIVTALRQSGPVTAAKTLVILGRSRHSSVGRLHARRKA